MNLKKISDIAKELQTDDFHKEVLNDIKQFVYKNQAHYHPHYKGDMYDLVLDLYEAFIKPKKHRDGEVYSELDRYDPAKLGGSDWTGTDSKKLAAYIQRYVINRLIDRERQSVKEINYDENLEEESTKPSLDYLVQLAERNDPRVEELEITPNMLAHARDVYDEMPTDAKIDFIRTFNKVKSDLPDNLLNLFTVLIGSDTTSSVAGKRETQSEIANKVKEVLGSDATVSEYKLQGKPALRIVFDTPEDAKRANAAEVDTLITEAGYTPYVKKGKAWYYFKNA